MWALKNFSANSSRCSVAHLIYIEVEANSVIIPIMVRYRVSYSVYFIGRFESVNEGVTPDAASNQLPLDAGSKETASVLEPLLLVTPSDWDLFYSYLKSTHKSYT